MSNRVDDPMPTRVALLRAVNVGGTGKLPMADLGAICAAAGYRNIQTVGASGNVLFETGDAPAKIQAELERRLRGHAGKPVVWQRRSIEEYGPPAHCSYIA